MSTHYRHILTVIVLLFTALLPESATVRGGLSQPQGIRTAAADETANGIALYQQGQNEDAIKILGEAARRYNNLRAWHYLGLALEKKGDAKEARKAHERAAKLGETLVETRLEDLRNSQGFFQSMGEIGAELAEAGQSAQKYIALNPGLSRSKQEEWSSRAEALLGYAETGKADPSAQTVFTSKQVDVKAIIWSRPDPIYTDDARRNLVSGVVVLRAILGADGRVVGLYPIKSLPNGLTASAIRAARLIKFEPALKDGKRVSMSVQIEYHFSVY